MTTGSHIAAAKIGDHANARQLSQQCRVADLDGEAARRFMAHCLAMATDGANLLRGQVLLLQEFVDSGSGQFDPVLLGNGRARQLIIARGAQRQQVATQLFRHGAVECREEVRALILINQRDVQPIQAGAGHHANIEGHGLLLVGG